MTLHDFHIVRSPPDLGILGISAVGTGLISTCTFLFCEVSASPAEGSKIQLASHPKPRGDEEENAVN